MRTVNVNLQTWKVAEEVYEVWLRMSPNGERTFDLIIDYKVVAHLKFEKMCDGVAKESLRFTYGEFGELRESYLKILCEHATDYYKLMSVEVAS